MKIRITGLPAEAGHALTILGQTEVFDVTEVSPSYPNRGTSRMIRVYAEVRLREDNEVSR